MNSLSELSAPSAPTNRRCSITDVGFVLDASYSIRVSYSAAKKFVNRLASEIQRRTNNARTALINFSNKADHAIKFKVGPSHFV